MKKFNVFRAFFARKFCASRVWKPVRTSDELGRRVEAVPRRGFSLVEMLMALLVASLLMVSLAPVMTKRFNENMTVNGNGGVNVRTKSHEIEYLSAECPNEVVDSDGSAYCEGEFVVPAGLNGNITVAVVGAGGGGGVAPAAGYVEYTSSGTKTFTVPAFTGKVEATLVSGGAGGGAGGQTFKKTDDWLTAGNYTWNVPAAARNKNVYVQACGAGGGGGGAGIYSGYKYFYVTNAGDGGRGGYINKLVTLGSAATVGVIIGGGGGGGGPAAGNDGRALSGTFGGGGGGGGDPGGEYSTNGGGGGSTGGAAGTKRNSNSYAGAGGERGDTSLTSNTNGVSGVLGSNSAGGTGASTGGTAYWTNFKYTHGVGGGGGGGSVTGYGGGGGGGSCGSSGGGGGGGATILGTRSAILAIAPGGGGGGGSGLDDIKHSTSQRLTESDYENRTGFDGAFIVTADGGRKHSSGGGGGGGGGTGGGNGGRGGTGGVAHASNGSNGAGDASTIFGSTQCAGGTAFHNFTDLNTSFSQIGGTGKAGAMRITYLDYGSGGSGGGGGQIVPIRPVNVTPNENLSIIVGKGASGGTAGSLSSSGTEVAPTIGGGANNNTEGPAMLSKIQRDNTVILTTAYLYNWVGSIGGSPTGAVYTWQTSPYYGVHGGVTAGEVDKRTLITVAGFVSTDGRTAGNGTTTGDITYAAGTVGGDGGVAKIFNQNTCVAAKGGTSTSPNGKDATGYGCGGGGGYGLAKGGNGSDGYARISWNKYWNTTNNNYDLASTGGAGGGASGNAMIRSIPVTSGEHIKIRIGKGGRGAYIQNNGLVAAIRGGDTVFFHGNSTKRLIAGGGGAGGSTTVVSNNLVNGTGGAISTYCHYGAQNLINNDVYCVKGGTGVVTTNANGGAGGSINLTRLSSSTNYVGGAGGSAGDNAYGRNAVSPYGAGGGGAGILDVGVPSLTTYNPNYGGNGANGKIILKWQE